MTYYPKSQIKTNKSTNGGEFVRTDNNQIYKGYYWQTSNGQYFTGKNPNDLPTIKILPIEQPKESTPLETTTEWVEDYPSKLTNSTPGLPPKNFKTQPTDENYKVGEFERYFTKKSNQNIYFEIAKDDYTKLSSKNPQIQYQLYIPIKISWQLVGDSYQVNKNTVKLTEQTQKLPGFTKYFKGRFDKYNKDRTL